MPVVLFGFLLLFKLIITTAVVLYIAQNRLSPWLKCADVPADMVPKTKIAVGDRRAGIVFFTSLGISAMIVSISGYIAAGFLTFSF